MNRNDEIGDEGNPLDRLPREMDPGPHLEERVVRALRAEGILRRKSGGRPLRVPLLAAAAAAAAVAIAWGGFTAGYRTGARQAMNLAREMREEDGRRVAEQVQRAGSAYLAALAVLARTGSGDPAARDQGREAAVAVLYAAAHRVADLAPEDPALQSIALLLSGGAENDSSGTGPEGDGLVWF
ncbi:MAG: hypothetical protein JW958_14080 [Candidatus Eisenbacteria bacterium]|nr:hypothetical protein [Candidatus Eisenbacteria bacterium]